MSCSSLSSESGDLDEIICSREEWRRMRRRELRQISREEARTQQSRNIEESTRTQQEQYPAHTQQEQSPEPTNAYVGRHSDSGLYREMRNLFSGFHSASRNGGAQWNSFIARSPRLLPVLSTLGLLDVFHRYAAEVESQEEYASARGSLWLWLMANDHHTRMAGEWRRHREVYGSRRPSPEFVEEMRRTTTAATLMRANNTRSRAERIILPLPPLRVTPELHIRIPPLITPERYPSILPPIVLSE
jgi:hypothetical protein